MGADISIFPLSSSPTPLLAMTVFCATLLVPSPNRTSDDVIIQTGSGCEIYEAVVDIFQQSMMGRHCNLLCLHLGYILFGTIPE